MNVLGFHRRNISVCMISRFDIILKVIEHFLNVKGYLFWNDQELVRHELQRERLEYYEERLVTKCCVKQKTVGSDYEERGIV